jgi:hypothetical protein
LKREIAWKRQQPGKEEFPAWLPMIAQSLVLALFGAGGELGFDQVCLKT